jgi:dTDP-4-amino-4,6-dideoxygalactose transaminase
MLSKNRFFRTILKRIYLILPFGAKILFAKLTGRYPRTVRREIKSIKQILGSTNWNMSYSINGKHVELEKEFARFIGSEYAIAVGSGGVGIQMLIRALGLNSDDQVIIQADTCSAVPQAILNAQAVPIFTDTSTESFQLSQTDLAQAINKKTKMVLATHMWGNPEDLESIEKLTANKDIFIIEDACLALGSKYENKYLGNLSKAGVFSFGSTKPLQSGEGGMLVTNDQLLAKELRMLRGWGDREIEYGVRDVTTLSWNGRMPEVIAAITLEQLKGYPVRLSKIQSRVARFRELVLNIADFEIVPTRNQENLAYTQLAIKLKSNSRLNKQEFMDLCSVAQIRVFHANFEPLTELSLFQNGKWLEWVSNKNELVIPTRHNFPGAYEIYNKTGIGLSRVNFESEVKYRNLVNFIKRNFH